MVQAQASYGTRGAQAGEKKTLTGINIPDPNHDRRIHQKILDRLPQSPSLLQEIGPGKRLGEGLRPQVVQARMVQEFRFGGQKTHTKTARVVEAQFELRSEVENKMVVRCIVVDRRPDPQTH